MTNGTSQGLFIVVAIIIFGIFVGLSYTVFGSEGLSNDLKGIFTNATEQALYTVKYDDSNNLIKRNTLMQHGGLKEANFTQDRNGKVTLTSDGTAYIGVRIPDTVMKVNTDYKFSFTMKTIEGMVTTIGGHMAYSDHTKIYIDGILVSDKTLEQIGGYLSPWYYGISLLNPYEEHTVEVIFNTNGINDPNNSWDMVSPDFKSMYIQPNRGKFGEAYIVELTDISLYEQPKE